MRREKRSVTAARETRSIARGRGVVVKQRQVVVSGRKVVAGSSESILNGKESGSREGEKRRRSLGPGQRAGAGAVGSIHSARGCCWPQLCQGQRNKLWA